MKNLISILALVINVLFFYSLTFAQSSGVDLEKELNLVFVEGGEFEMGSDWSDAGELDGPVRKVEVSGFYIGKYEVTNKEFCVFLNEEGNQSEEGFPWVYLNKDEWSNPGIALGQDAYYVRSGFENHPITGLSIYGARAYCAWLSEVYEMNIRLPQESEWEFAAKGGNKSQFYKYSGSNKPDDVAWYKTEKDSSLTFQAVGLKLANELGIYDMSGNVYEYCLNLDDDFFYNDLPEIDNGPSSISRVFHVLRGGSVFVDEKFVATSTRTIFLLRKNIFYRSVGFRIVVEP